jgi:hypothetical protein
MFKNYFYTVSGYVVFQRFICLNIFICFCGLAAAGQSRYDSVLNTADSSKAVRVMCYPYRDKVLMFSKPKAFGFITGIPKTFRDAGGMTFRKKSIPAISVIAGSTALLIALDQNLIDGVQHFSSQIGLDASRDYKTLVGFKLGSTQVNVYEAPRNLNSALYSIGEGSTSILITAGLFTYGKIKNDYRALRTSSQLMQSLLAVGITTQVLKRITGRESPFASSERGGQWRPFTNPGTYQKTVSRYDAFPSGHLATMVATFVVVSENYPEKRWIKPVGYGLITAVCFAMMNNGVHWAGDYPLAAGIGYVCAKATVNLNRWVTKR